MSPRSAEVLTHIAIVLDAERPEETTGVEARFPELRGVFERYVAYCDSQSLGCKEWFERVLSRRPCDGSLWSR
jgi:hypothetical protein